MEVLRTYITQEEVEAQKARPNFKSIHHYGTLVPEPGEIGSIVVDRVVEEHEHCTVSYGGRCVERIFLAG